MLSKLAVGDDNLFSRELRVYNLGLEVRAFVDGYLIVECSRHVCLAIKVSCVRPSRLTDVQVKSISEDWSRLARTYCHADVPSLEPLPHPVPRKCAYFGRCLCSGQGRVLNMFEDRVVSALKRHFPRSHKNDAEAKRARLALKAGDVIIRLEGTGVHWYHLAYANLSSWAFSLVTLVPSEDEEFARSVLPDIALEACRESEWRSSYDAFGLLDLSGEWRCSFYSLVGSFETTADLKPYLLRVRRITEIDLLWSGLPRE